MSKISDFLIGKVVLEEIESPINGTLTVVRDLTWGLHIQGGGITQSGGVAKSVWKTSLTEAHKQKPKIKNCLILGLGGGSIAELVSDFWNNSKITGVDIDPLFVELGKKHLKLRDLNVKIIIDDAYEYVKTDNKKYDLICVDTYIGDQFPEKLQQKVFLQRINKLLSKSGIAIFNRLYYDEKRKEAEDFAKKLEKEFSKVERVFPEANIMFLCKN